MNTKAAALTRLLRQLDKTQWQPSEDLQALQFRQLANLVAHCEKSSPQFRRRLEQAGLATTDLFSAEGLRRLPVLSRRELQSSKDVFCETVPAAHGATNETRTSGSTGEPVVVRRTAISNLDWMAITIREQQWHRRDFQLRFCAVRAHIAKPVRYDSWGPPVNLLFQSGPLLGIPITTDIDAQIAMIADFKPQILLVYPSVLAALARKDIGDALSSVKHIHTIGETLSPQTREDASAAFGADIADMYSSQELGNIALQCPDSDLYHVMAENLIVEVLNADGTPCRDGEVGRVTITDLRNYATPLIRYDIGDYAEVGPPCCCGRSLPTLRRILGRERNLILMPDGTRHWPLVGFHKFRTIAPVVQYQLIQDGRETVEVRLVTERPLRADEEASLGALIQKALGFAFTLTFVYFDREIPAGPNGKFEEFVCRL